MSWEGGGCARLGDASPLPLPSPDLVGREGVGRGVCISAADRLSPASQLLLPGHRSCHREGKRRIRQRRSREIAYTCIIRFYRMLFYFKITLVFYFMELYRYPVTGKLARRCEGRYCLETYVFTGMVPEFPPAHSENSTSFASSSPPDTGVFHIVGGGGFRLQVVQRRE